MEYSMGTNNKRKYMDEHNGYNYNDDYFGTPIKKKSNDQ